MTAPASDPDPQFADLLDDLLDQLLDGKAPDLAAVAARHPAVAHRVAEANALASDVASRREQRQPSLRGYTILRELGRGGMGTVYLARQQQLDRDVALKVLPHSFGLSASNRQQFLAEAKALARVKHEHIVDIHRIVDDGTMLAFEMEYVDGPSLQTMLTQLRELRERTGEPPTLRHAAEAIGLPVHGLHATNLTTFFVQIAVRVARALGAVHAAGFVHRDVKPANVMLRKNGQPVLTDFGLVRAAALERSQRSGFAGTPVYSAPEQLRGNTRIGPAADVYALAVTLYECLTLAPPFAGQTTADLLRRIESGRAPSLRRHAPHAPRDLATIIAHAMEVEPERRYADGNALADDLQRLLDLQPILARPDGPLRRTAKFLRRNRPKLLAGGAGAALVAVALWPFFDRVEAAARAERAVREHVRAARSELLSPDCRRAAHYAAWGTAGAAGQSGVAAALQRANAGYDRALAVAPDDAVARREQVVARTVAWLRQLSLPHAGSLAEALASPQYRELAAALPPRTRELAAAIAAGKVATLDVTAMLKGCSDDDRQGFGLLSFLTGEFRLCEAAFGDADDAATDQALRDACLGLACLDSGAPERAYVHLQAAQRDLPEVALALELADASLALGEIERARHWLYLVPASAETEAGRRRVLADIEAARGDEQAARAMYVELAGRDPFDPVPQQRLAQLLIRGGRLAAAAQRLDELLGQWPGCAPLRLDRARVALQQRDAGAYLRQVLAVLATAAEPQKATRLPTELLEVLRLGGLTRLHGQMRARSRGDSNGRTFLGGELPLRAFVPAPVVDRLELLLPSLSQLELAIASVRACNAALEGAQGFALVTVPLALARLPALATLLPPGGRPLCELLPWVANRAMPYVLPLRRRLVELLPTGWWRIEFVPVVPPADLSPEHQLGTSLARGADWNGDGIAELLVGCESNSPQAVPGRVLIVDGRSARTLAEVKGQADGTMFGHAVALLGDVDGDGIADWLAGAPAGTPETLHGLAEVRSGRDQHLIDRLVGDDASFGVDVAGLGDVDGDGCPDFAVGMPPLVSNAADQGRVFVHSGRTRGVLRVLANDLAGAWFGASLANAGDTDADGVPDLVIGGNLLPAPGLVRLHSGRTGEVLHSWSDPDPAAGFGYLVAGAGDLDGDGHGDVAITALSTRDAGDPGRVHLFSGRSGTRLTTMIGDVPGAMFGTSVVRYELRHLRVPLLVIGSSLGGSGACGKFEFRTARGDKVSTVLGPEPYSLFGSRLTIVDDLDGDGRPELFSAGPQRKGGGSVLRIDSTGIRFGM